MSAFAAAPALAQKTEILEATADAFVRANDPTVNYGGGGGLTCGGTDSLDGNAAPCGRFDSVIRFDAAPAIPAFNASYPAGWRISAAHLVLAEIATPTSALFPRGPGNVAVSWLSRDDWIEGVGNPSSPGDGSDGEITWNSLLALRAAGVEVPLGTFPRTGTSAAANCPLALSPTFVADAENGGLITLQLTPANAAVGFICNSCNFGDPTRRPMLFLTAVPTYAEADANCDGAVDFFDIDPFLLALFDLPTWTAGFCSGNIDSADVNDSGAVDFFDIDPFLAALFGN